jgi:hypothetical protein
MSAKISAKEVPVAAADTVLADELGVPADVVEDIRRQQLLEGEHWTREGNRIVFTPAGLDAVREKLDLPPTPLEQKEEPPPECACEIVRLHPNPVVVRVRVPSGVLADVRVRAPQALRLRVKLLCRLRLDGRWECCQPGHAVTLPPLQKKGEAAHD